MMKRIPICRSDFGQRPSGAGRDWTGCWSLMNPPSKPGYECRFRLPADGVAVAPRVGPAHQDSAVRVGHDALHAADQIGPVVDQADRVPAPLEVVADGFRDA